MYINIFYPEYNKHQSSLAAVLLFFIIIIPIFFAFYNSAAGQAVTKSSYGAWVMVCDTPVNFSKEQCALIQNVISDENENVGLSVVALKTINDDMKILRILAPLGVLLPNGIEINIDNKNIAHAYFIKCYQDGCYAETSLQAELLQLMKTSKTVNFIIFNSPEEGIGIPVDLSGFSEGYEMLP